MDIRPDSIPTSVRTRVIDESEYDEDGVRIREATKSVTAEYAWQTTDGHWINADNDKLLHFSGLGEGEGEIIRVNCYGIDGAFRGGPFQCRVVSARALYTT